MTLVELRAYPGLTVETLEPLKGETVSAFLRRSKWGHYVRGIGWQFTLPTICIFNGKPLLRRHWSRKKIKPKDEVHFLNRPLGGGGGSGQSGSKQVMGIVAMIAIAALAFWAGPALGTLMGLGSFGSSLISAAIGIGGSMLISSIMAPKAGGQPKQDDDGGIANLSVSGNQIKPQATRPSWYGRLKRLPDFAATPWSEYRGNEQYLNVLLSLGEGKHVVHQILNDDTLLWDEVTGFTNSFQAVELEFYDADEEITLFPSNVVSASEVSGNEISTDYSGPFIVNAAGTDINKIAVDVMFPQGLMRTDPETGQRFTSSAEIQAEYREVDDAGVPVGGGGWTVLFNRTYEKRNSNPLRFSEVVTVPAARYEVRVRRFGSGDNGPNEFNQATWIGLRGYVVGDASIPVQTIAMRMRSSGQLTDNSARRFGIISTRILPVWNGTTFVEEPTRNPFYAALDIATNTDYGAGRPIGKIDLDTLVSMADDADTRGDNFDYDFTSPMPASDAIDVALRVSRTRHFWAGDTMSFVRDENRPTTDMVISDMEVVRDSTKIEWLLSDADSADSVILEYVDEDTWKPAEIQYPPNSLEFTAQNPSRIQIDGIVNRDHGFRETAFWYRQHLFRRTNINFNTEYDGRRLTFGSRIRFQSSLPTGWGQSGEILDRTGNTLTLSPAPEWDSGEDHFILVRDKRGREWGPVLVTEGADPDLAILDTTDLALVEGQQGPLNDALDRAEGSNPPSFDFSVGENTSRVCIVLNGNPSGDNQISLSLVMDDDRVHDTPDDDPPLIPSPQFPQDQIAPIVLMLSANFRQGQLEPILDASWWPSSNATHYIAEISYDFEDAYEDKNWIPIYQGSQPNFSAVVDRANLTLRVAAVGARHGPFAVVEAEVPTLTLGGNVVGLDSLIGGLKDYVANRLQERENEFEKFRQQIGWVVANQEAFNATDKMVLTDLLKVEQGDRIASISEVREVAISATEAIATLETTVTAEVGLLNASISEVSEAFEAFAGPGGTFATYQTSVSSQFSTTNDNVSAITSSFNTFAGPGGTFATYQNSVTSQFNGVNASITTLQGTVTGLDGALAAAYTVKLDVNGYATGFEIYGGSDINTFTIITDYFRIAKPGTTGGTAKAVFEIATVGGVASIALRGDIFADGTITAAKIQAGAITAAKLNADVFTAVNANITNLTAANINSFYAIYNNLGFNAAQYTAQNNRFFDRNQGGQNITFVFGPVLSKSFVAPSTGLRIEATAAAKALPSRTANNGNRISARLEILQNGTVIRQWNFGAGAMSNRDVLATMDASINKFVLVTSGATIVMRMYLIVELKTLTNNTNQTIEARTDVTAGAGELVMLALFPNGVT